MMISFSPILKLKLCITHQKIFIKFCDFRQDLQRKLRAHIVLRLRTKIELYDI